MPLPTHFYGIFEAEGFGEFPGVNQHLWMGLGSIWDTDFTFPAGVDPGEQYGNVNSPANFADVHAAAADVLARGYAFDAGNTYYYHDEELNKIRAPDELRCGHHNRSGHSSGCSGCSGCSGAGGGRHSRHPRG